MEKEIILSVVITAIVSGVFWLVLFAFVSSVSCRRKKRAKANREMEFTLPDRENTFIRARLSTVLNREFREGEGQEEKLAIEFSQALKMLDKISFASLSTAERIEVGEMQRELRLFQAKESFSVKEVFSINEQFSRLLKLSAKYGV